MYGEALGLEEAVSCRRGTTPPPEALIDLVINCLNLINYYPCGEAALF